MSKPIPGVMVVFGQPGCGKTHMLVRAIHALAPHGAVLVLDVTGDMRTMLEGLSWKKNHVEVIHSLDEYRDRQGSKWLPLKTDLRVGPGTILVIQSHKASRDVSRATEAFEELTDIEDKNGDRIFKTVVCDEAEHLFYKGQATPRQEKQLLTARNHGQVVILATKRATRISTIARSCALRVAVGQLGSDADAKATELLMPRILLKSDIKGVVNLTQSLKRGEYVFYDGNAAFEPLVKLNTDTFPPPWCFKKLTT